MNIKNSRYGMYAGKKILFTHYNPTTHEAWGDDIVIKRDNNIEYGAWVSYDSIEWIR